MGMDDKKSVPALQNDEAAPSGAPTTAVAPPPSAPNMEQEIPTRNAYPTVIETQPPANEEVPPPPSYHVAMSYPAAPTYGGAEPPKMYGSSEQPPIYYQQPAGPPPFITNTRLAQPSDAVVQAIRAHVTPNSTNVVVHIQQGVQCRHCHSGVVTRQTDMCCLLCLVLLTIFTFPLGLIFLCCVPCTVQNRCSNCQRLA